MSEPQSQHAVTPPGHIGTSGNGASGATASDAPKEATSIPVQGGAAKGADVDVRSEYEQRLHQLEEESKMNKVIVGLMFEFMHTMIIDFGGIRRRFDKGDITPVWDEYIARKKKNIQT